MRKLKKDKGMIFCNNCKILITDDLNERKVPILRNTEKTIEHFCKVDCLMEHIKIEDNLKNNKNT